MATSKKTDGSNVRRVLVDEFRRDSSDAFREVRERGIVTIIESDGQPRMHILRQLDSLED